MKEFLTCCTLTICALVLYTVLYGFDLKNDIKINNNQGTKKTETVLKKSVSANFFEELI